ncbi:MAG: hydroxymethylglutaryl-CoA synthase [Pseudonocardiaceae bacterium]|nr:hydroxymethylglutaryl-CoA synthase [Pseudonocardiaceae bacterium]
MVGLLAYGAYVPYHRLQRAAIGGVLGSGGGSGTRSVASYDEDSTSMGVEAARVAVSSLPDRSTVRSLHFATATPAYLDKTNATAVHAALDLDRSALAVDAVGSVRSGVGALLAAAGSREPALAVLSDVRTGLPGGADESAGGDGAAAFVLGDGIDGAPVVVELLGSASASVEALERWRIPGAVASRVWEERFGEEVYVPLAAEVFGDACKQAGVTADEIDDLVVAGLHSRAVGRIARSLGTRPDAAVDDLTGSIGNAGTAQPGIVLADALDRADAGQTVALVVVGDGVSVLLWRTTEALAHRRPQRSVAAQVAGGNDGLPYATFLSWRGMLDREPPRRPDPEHPYAPPSLRRVAWKFGFVASRCVACGMRHLPPSRVCGRCHAADAMVPEPMADLPARIATYTVDRLASTPSPPLLMVVCDYDGGGRFRCELTDAAPEEATIGGRVEMTFRKTVTAGGIHNYFWKARPIRSADGGVITEEPLAGSSISTEEPLAGSSISTEEPLAGSSISTEEA